MCQPKRNSTTTAVRGRTDEEMRNCGKLSVKQAELAAEINRSPLHSAISFHQQPMLKPLNCSRLVLSKYSVLLVAWLPFCFWTILINASTVSPAAKTDAILILDAQPISRSLSSDSRAYIVTGPNFGIYTAHGEIFSITPKRGGKYTFIVQSDESQLVIWLSKAGTPIKSANDEKEALMFRNQISAELQANTTYELGVGAKGFADETLPKLPVHYRVGVYSKPDSPFPDDPLQPIDQLFLGSNIIDFQHHVSQFGHYPARRFKIKLAENKKQWIQITAKGFGIDPLIEIWPPFSYIQNQLNKAHHSKINTHQSTAQIDGDTANVAILASGEGGRELSEVEMSRLANNRITVQVNAYATEPIRGLSAKLREVLNDPIVSLPTGVFLGGLISYLFYRRSVARRLILYKLQYDNTVLRADDALKSSRLRVMRGDEPITEHVGVCSVSIRFQGHRDLREEEIIEPIRLKFKGMTSILRATATGSTGWKSLSIPATDPMSVEVGVKHLSAASSLTVNVFYTQAEYEGITVDSSGQLVDGEIRRDSNNIFSRRAWILLLVLATLYFPLIGVATLVDNYLVQLPFWLYHLKMNAVKWWWLWLILYGSGQLLSPQSPITKMFTRFRSSSVRERSILLEAEPAPRVN